MATHILVVDDETAIADLVEVYLKNEGFTIHKFYNASDALACVRTTRLNLAVLDVMLPDMDGFTLCQRIREDHLFPIIMLTAKVEDMDKITGLTLGADDYITKPFNPLELVARVKAVLRRYQAAPAPAAPEPPQQGEYVEYPDLTVNLTNYAVTYCGHSVEMPPKELELLYFLASSPNQVFTREQLLDHIWGYEYIGDTRTVDVHIKRLREKIKDHANWALTTVWGIGYKFEVRK